MRWLLLIALLLAAASAGAQKRVKVRDFVTASEATFVTAAGDTAVMDLHAGFKQGVLRGDLVYFDPKLGTVFSTAITAYRVVDSVTRTIEGQALLADQSVTFTVTVADKGEPAREDTVSIAIDGYAASGTLIAGNIQLHVSARKRVPREQ